MCDISHYSGYRDGRYLQEKHIRIIHGGAGSIEPFDIFNVGHLGAQCNVIAGD
ncbi:hypothetical protein BDP27DRAFT_1332993 [Rhodocollybia butyracea]|uniref:Uncharacterized protein n=1 Tax=Rhodocollybia butyracea TaxID=206335 RepID=A0A9P5U2M0_9AGAR|nr:hypothetical protein BDP27DRAFT_1332993 [Rhodocollybia butyracea]